MGDARNHPYEASTLRVTALPCNCNYNFLLDDKRRKKRGSQIKFLVKRPRSGDHRVIWFVVGLSFLLVSNFTANKLLTPELVATLELIFSKFNEIDFLVLNFAAIINSLMFVFSY